MKSVWNHYIDIEPILIMAKAKPEEAVTVATPIVVAPKKTPGYKSTEFYMSMFAMGIGAVVSSGAIEENEFATKIVGLVMAALVALGYTGSRLTLKKLDAGNDASTGTNS